MKPIPRTFRDTHTNISAFPIRNSGLNPDYHRLGRTCHLSTFLLSFIVTNPVSQGSPKKQTNVPYDGKSTKEVGLQDHRGPEAQVREYNRSVPDKPGDCRTRKPTVQSPSEKRPE